MIISFSVENWMSFRGRVTFSMVASRERQHGARVPRLSKYNMRVLPIAAIYGGNASGKTNLFQALNFAKSLVVKGTQPDSLIQVDPFRLDPEFAESPTKMSFELLIGETIYEFSFTVTRKEVLEEKLVQITSTSEKIMYDRKNNKINFMSSLDKDKFLRFAFHGTRENQLFLTNSVSQKVDNFRPIYDWFNNSLVLIAPDSRFRNFELFFDEGHPLYEPMNLWLSQLDTGIIRLGGEDMPLKNAHVPEEVKSQMREQVKDGETFLLMGFDINDRFLVNMKKGELFAKKLITYHPRIDGSEVRFEIAQESDGSQRLIELLPAFLDLSINQAGKVYIIDELDRSLHTLLIKQLLEAYLSNCSSISRNQLLFTTHDVLLMDQQLLRRDEMWVAERNIDGVSNLISFSEYKDIRYDKDIRKSYLQGRLGGIPRLLLKDTLVINDTADGC